MNYKVKIFITSYNQLEYLQECVDSILCQKTNFPYQVIVSDNCSTDGTLEYLETVKKKYQDKFTYIVGKQNGGAYINLLRIFKLIDTEYFALMCGDDFWIGEGRLQKQIDFLERNPQFSMCSGQTYFKKEDEADSFLCPPLDYCNLGYTLSNYFYTPVLYHLSSIVYRNVLFKDGTFFKTFSDLYQSYLEWDENFIRLLHLEKGDLYALPEVVSCYRYSGKGLWSKLSKEEQAIENAIQTFYIYKFCRDRHPELREIMLKQMQDYYQLMLAALINNQVIYPKNTLSLEATEKLAYLLVEIKKDERFLELMEVQNSYI